MSDRWPASTSARIEIQGPVLGPALATPEPDPPEVVQARKLLEAWDAMECLLGSWAAQCADVSEALFAGFDRDDFVRGMLVGEGYAWDRASKAFAHAGNAMRMAREASNAEVSGD